MMKQRCYGIYSKKRLDRFNDSADSAIIYLRYMWTTTVIIAKRVEVIRAGSSALVAVGEANKQEVVDHLLVQEALVLHHGVDAAQ